MPVFAMPIVLMIDADSVEEAQKSIDDWTEEIDIDNDLPIGTEDMDTSPNCENNDEGQRLLYLPIIDNSNEEDLDETDNEDNFDSDEEVF